MGMRSVISLAAVLLALLVQSVSADIYFGGVKYNAIHFGGAGVHQALRRCGAEHHSGGVALGGARRVGTLHHLRLDRPEPRRADRAQRHALHGRVGRTTGRNAGLFSVNTTDRRGPPVWGRRPTTLGSTRQRDVPGALASHGGVLYMVGDRNNALYTVNATTGVATRVGSATAFGNSETTPGGAGFVQRHALPVGSVAGPLHPQHHHGRGHHDCGASAVRGLSTG